MSLGPLDDGLWSGVDPSLLEPLSVAIFVDLGPLRCRNIQLHGSRYVGKKGIGNKNISWYQTQRYGVVRVGEYSVMRVSGYKAWGYGVFRYGHKV